MSRSPMFFISLAGFALAASGTFAQTNLAQRTSFHVQNGFGGLGGGGCYGPGGISGGYYSPQRFGGGVSSIDLLTYPASSRYFPEPPTTVTYYPSYYAPCGPSCSNGVGAGCPPYATPYATSAYGANGSGLTVNGHYSGDKWNIAFHLGSGSPEHVVSQVCGPCYTPCYAPVYSYPAYSYLGGYGYGAYWADGLGYSYTHPYGPSTYGQDPRLYMNGPTSIAPATTSTPAANTPATSTAPVTPPTPLELGKVALSYGQPKVAIEAFKRELKEKGNTSVVLRFLAIALMADKQVDDAAAVLRSAYRIDPKLGADPLDFYELGFDKTQWRDFVSRAVVNANHDKTASAWLLVATLMQAQGRPDLAHKMIEKAQHAGLEAEIAVSFPPK